MDLSKTYKWRDGNGNGNANPDAKVSTIHVALPVLCTGELISIWEPRNGCVNCYIKICVIVRSVIMR